MDVDGAKSVCKGKFNFLVWFMLVECEWTWKRAGWWCVEELGCEADFYAGRFCYKIPDWDVWMHFRDWIMKMSKLCFIFVWIFENRYELWS